MDINNIKNELNFKVVFGRTKHKTIGLRTGISILNKGRNNRFIKNRFSGLEIGIQDEGENTYAEGNILD